MALSDPFPTVYEGASKAYGSLGENILGIAGLYAQRKQKEREMQMEMATKLFPYTRPTTYTYTDPATGKPVTYTMGGQTDPETTDMINQILFQSMGRKFFKAPKGEVIDTTATPVMEEKSLSLPSGLQVVQSGKTTKIIPPKLPTTEEMQQQREKSEFIKTQAQDSLDTIAEVEKGISNFGLTGQLPSIPGSSRTIWEANVNKLLSGKMIDLMTQMKEASKTGATGFGQLSEKEGQILREASTALKRQLPPQEAQKILNKMKIPLQKILQGSNLKSKIDRANEIAKQNPNFTKQQIIDIVNKELGQ